MGKVLRILVIILAIIGIVATYFAYVNYSKREILIGRTHALEAAVEKLAGFVEAQDAEEVPQPSYPERDISEVVAREIETPERADFWSTYKHIYEPSATPIPRLDYKPFSREYGNGQLARYYRLDEATGKPVINAGTGRPYTTGEGTMNELIERLLERARQQYSTLANTRAELPKLRNELISTIEELNRQKQSGRKDKCTIVQRDNSIAQLETEKRDLEDRNSRLQDEIKEVQSLNDDLNEKNAELEEENQKLDDVIAQQRQEIDELKGKNAPVVLPTSAATATGVLTPGDKGKVVAFDDVLKYAVIEFSDEFMTELIGVDRNQPLPQEEVMVRRAGIASDAKEAFVTRLRLSQVFRDKNLIIADILFDWQQQPLKIGDIVFF